MSIVVLESPCKPAQSAVEALLQGPFWLAQPNLHVWRSDDFLDCVKRGRGVTTAVGARAVIRLRNTYYARAAMLDCLLRGEAPYASHLLYTQVLDDDVEEERHRGMEAGIELSHHLLLDEDAQHVFYDELGISGGMRAAAAKLYPSDAPPRYDLRQLGEKARAWYLERVPASIAWLK